MTHQQKTIKKYVNDIEHYLHLPRKTKARINCDLATDIHARLEKGETIEDIIASMGTPKEVANGFNSELSEYKHNKNPWRFLFLFLAILTGVYSITNLLSDLILPELMYSIIGEADGPTSICVSTVVATPQWLLVPFVLGCIATYFLLNCQKNSNKKNYTIVIILSISALAFFVVDLTWESIHMFLKMKDNVVSIKGNFGTSILLGAMESILYPSFWLPLITLIISIRKRKAVQS